MTHRLILLMCCAAIFVSTSCDKKTSSRKTIAVIPKGLTHSFWKSVKAGADKAGKELGVDIKWDGPPQESEINTQSRIVGDMINRGVDAIVVAPVSQSALTSSLIEAKKKVPVVIFDSGSTFKDYDAYIATNNYEGGKLAGQHMLKLIGDAKNVELAIICYGAESESTLQRERGFIDEVKKNPNIKLYSDQYAGATADLAQTLTTNIFQAHPGISAVFASNESTTQGALGALGQMKKLGQIKFVGFDSSAALSQALEKGNIQALVLQNPVQMGYLSVKAAVAKLNNQPVAKEQPITPMLATTDNKDTPAIKELLHPALD